MLFHSSLKMPRGGYLEPKLISSKAFTIFTTADTKKEEQGCTFSNYQDTRWPAWQVLSVGENQIHVLKP